MKYLMYHNSSDYLDLKASSTHHKKGEILSLEKEQIECQLSECSVVNHPCTPFKNSPLIGI